MKIENLCVKYDKNIVIENFSLNLTLGEKIIIYVKFFSLHRFDKLGNMW